jgi:ABC-type uncharacterized transport system auxiliary subunit
MKPAGPLSLRLCRPAAAVGLWLVAVALLWGCGGSPSQVQRYLLEYSPPSPPARAPLEAALAIEPFAVNQAFNSTAMVYRPSPNVRDSYRYHRWRVDPGAMVTDFLRRDFRQAGVFKAVLPKDSGGDSRFRLEGAVEEIQEIDDPTGWRASLALTVTLLDTKSPDLTTRVVMQKTYRTEELMPEKTPQGLAQGVSVAMQRLSREIITEVYQAARRRLGG